MASARYASSFTDAELLDTMDGADARRKELVAFQACVKHNPGRLRALTTVKIMSGHTMDAESCVPVRKEILRQILHDAAMMVLAGMRVDGTANNWSNGGFGSRWFDMDAERYGIDFIRAAFYSKKTYGAEWKYDTPYVIMITAEKARK